MTIVFSFPEYEDIADSIAENLGAIRGDATIRNFPDKESYVRLKTDVSGWDVIVVCGLDNPNQKIMALMFFVCVAREMGAKSVGLVAPYLGYMRQDIRFKDGEAVSADLFANLLSGFVDWLVTMDPHLHRHEVLDELYPIPNKVVHANTLIARWIRGNVTKPVLIGPDKESKQWVSEVAREADAPYIILNKIRRGDRDVEVSIPNVGDYQRHTPVLVDDIISTAHTMIETVEHLNMAGMRPPVCIGVHAIFAGDAYEKLADCGVEKIITCNTIDHKSNMIKINDFLAEAVKNMVT